ncbi:MAG: YaeQ family protein [Natronospirillum sp.]
MAKNSTIIKARLAIADIDRGYYADHSLTLAQHPSETDDRLMIRILAFVLNASEHLAFAKGLSDEDNEPELAEKTLTGDIKLWVAFGTPDEKWLRKASNRAEQVQLFAYGERSLAVWWKQQESTLRRFDNLTVWSLTDDEVSALGALLSRGMTLQCNISEGQAWLSSETGSVTVEPVKLKG